MTKNFGQQGEQIIINYLRDRNFTIIAQNYKKFFGEIDIIAQNKDVIAFIEVKARKNNTVSLHDLVTIPKQQKIIKVAQTFIAERLSIEREQNLIFRFDVALLHIQNYKEPTITYIANAFYQNTH